MVLNNAIPTRPSPEESGPGGSDRGASCGELIAAGVRLAVLTPIAGLAVFAALQCTRIELWRQIWVEAREGTAATLAPDEVERYAGWFCASRNLWMREGRGVSWDGVIRRLFDEPEPRFVLVGWVVLVFLFAVALGAAMSVLASRSRLVAYELPWSLRARLVAAAMRSAVPWSVTAGVAAFGACWFIGYDRDGGTTSLLDGLLPTTGQAAWAFSGWAACAAVLCVAFARPSLRKLAPTTRAVALCPRCRYPRTGLAGGTCPECGAGCDGMSFARLPTGAQVHRRIARIAAGVIAMIALPVGVAASVSSRASDWLRLCPRTPGWVFYPCNNTLGEEPLLINTIYGTVAVTAHKKVGEPGGSWMVRWSLEPHERSINLIRVVSFSVEPHPLPGVACAVRRETPAGPLWFWQDPGGDRLLIGTPRLIAR
ncbi:MAG: hypothetical protein ACK4WH_07720 [Phycisphaerales bacterium]